MKRPSAPIVLGWAALALLAYAVTTWRQVKMEEIRARPQPMGLEERLILKDR
jgi:hypothetical protein